MIGTSRLSTLLPPTTEPLAVVGGVLATRPVWSSCPVVRTRPVIARSELTDRIARAALTQRAVHHFDRSLMPENFAGRAGTYSNRNHRHKASRKAAKPQRKPEDRQVQRTTPLCVLAALRETFLVPMRSMIPVPAWESAPTAPCASGC